MIPSHSFPNSWTLLHLEKLRFCNIVITQNTKLYVNKIVKLWTTLEYYLLFGIQTLVCSFHFLNRLLGDIPNSRMGKIHIVKELIFQTNLQMYSHSQSKSPQDRF